MEAPEPTLILKGIDVLGSFLTALVTWGLVVIGWIVVNDQNKHADIVRANHERLNDFRRLLDELEASAVDWHQGSFDEFKARKTVRTLKKIGIECKLLAECGALDDGWRVRMIALRRAITFNNFDRGRFVSQGSDSTILANIAAAKDDFEQYAAGRTTFGLKRTRSVWSSLKSVFSGSTD